MGFINPILQGRKPRHGVCWKGSVTYLRGEFGKDLSPVALLFWARSLRGLSAYSEHPVVPLLRMGSAVSPWGLCLGGKFWLIQEGCDSPPAHGPEPHTHI